MGVTDASVAAIARGCPMLQMINLAYCTKVTDDALISLSKCSMLNTLEIRGCPQVSSAGLSAIAVGCRKIAKLDIKKCYDINDAGMLSLARLSQNLCQVLINISQFYSLCYNSTNHTKMMFFCLSSDQFFILLHNRCRAFGIVWH